MDQAVHHQPDLALAEGAALYPPVGYTHTSVVLMPSPVQGHGLFANTPIPKGTTLCSWSGYPVDRAAVPQLSDQAKRYIIRVHGSSDFMLSSPLVDAMVGGALDLDTIGSMFMVNSAIHCNCRATQMSINQYNRFRGQPQLPRDVAGVMRDVIVLKARRDIQAGEELTYNYGVTH
ncbi:hypothetical protein COO60DRAFT_1643844 [Scenedesmus sp. NREL 46B-D3]|nr:hypothetical protein COO60DRAFT_1643844 [Scenedesmus sp. NREL 46B-D3]